MKHTTLELPFTAKELRDSGIALAEENADETWRHLAYECLIQVARRCRELTAPMIADAMRMNHQHVETHNHKALGGIMMRGKRQGVIAPTERFVPGEDPKSHACPKRVWRSLIFKP